MEITVLNCGLDGVQTLGTQQIPDDYFQRQAENDSERQEA